jgi:hypothetical protein
MEYSESIGSFFQEQNAAANAPSEEGAISKKTPGGLSKHLRANAKSWALSVKPLPLWLL